MLTATCEPNVSTTFESAQSETLPSDREISDREISLRVLRIRSRWTPSERVRRRQMAEERFADLLTALVGFEAA